MSKWVLLGLRTGIKTTLYPNSAETAPGGSPGRPSGMLTGGVDSKLSVIPLCPTEAIYRTEDRISVAYRRCIHCFRCIRGTSEPLEYESGYEWASPLTEDSDPSRKLGKPFARSVHMRLVDAGACRACLS